MLGLVAALVVSVLRRMNALHGQLLVAQRRLVLAEARREQLFEDDPTPLLVLDPGQQRLVAANAAASRLYGRPRAELLGLRPS